MSIFFRLTHKLLYLGCPGRPSSSPGKTAHQPRFLESTEIPEEMSVKEFIAKHSTPDKAILSDNDSKQLSYVFDLKDHQFLVQEYHYVSSCFDLKS